MGVHLLDYLQFEDLSRRLRGGRRWEFLFVAAPLRIPRRHRLAAQPDRDPLSQARVDRATALASSLSAGRHTTESVLGEISKQVQPTRTAVLAQVTEQSPEVIDAAMARLGGGVLRRPAVDVEEEIAAAEEAQRKAKHEARKELQTARVEKTKADAHAKVEEMKAKLHRSKAGANA